MSKTGRNEPCPCGSGKKFKHCCGKGKDNVIPFPAASPGPGERPADLPDDLFSEPSLMESLGKPNAATEVLREMESAARDQDFESQEELEAYLEQFVEAKNSSAVDEFLGFSPEQMYRVQNKDFEENADIVELTLDNCRNEELLETPLIQEGLFVLRYIAEQGRIKATAKLGNFPMALVREYVQQFVNEKDRRVAKPRHEDDLAHLGVLRLLLEYSGFLKKTKGHFSLTKKAETMLAHNDWKLLYREFFLNALDRVNWLYSTRMEDEVAFLQHFVIFDLYILKQKAGDFIAVEELAMVLAKAFPNLVEELEKVDPYLQPIANISNTFEYCFLERILTRLGLVELQRSPRHRWREPQRCRTTGLFDRILRWHV